MNSYKVIFVAGQTEGVYGISLVDEPAIECNWVALSKEQSVKLATIDEEKRILLGPILVPDKVILRKDDQGEPYSIVFPKDTIRLAMENFFQMGFQQNSTVGHHDKSVYEKVKLSGVTVVESWISEDPEKDKSALYGFTEPVGTAYVAMKINNDEVWNDYVKTGKVKGFSIDGLFGFEKINLNKVEMSTENSIGDKIALAIENGFKKVFGKSKVDLGKVDVNDGSLSLEFDGDEVKAGETQVSMKDADGNVAPVPDGEYKTTEDTPRILVVSGSIVTEIKEVPAEEAKPEETAPEQLNEEQKQTVKQEEFIQKVVYAMAEQSAKIIEKATGEMKTQMEAHIEKVLTDKEEAIQLTKNKPAPEKPWEQMTALERRRANKNK